MLPWLLLAASWALVRHVNTQTRNPPSLLLKTLPIQLVCLAYLAALHPTKYGTGSHRDSDATFMTVVALSLLAHSTIMILHNRRWRAVLPLTKPPKDAATSSVSYRYKMSPAECDEHGRVYGGELLKLIDVSAGLVAAKHAGGPCLTISADRVIFLEEIRVGDVISISSAVNRAWGSSMEIGVRVMRQSRFDPLKSETYTCHAYLTFVAKPTPPPPPGFWLGLTDMLGLTRPPPPRRAQLPEIKPSSLLEQKRYLLAGRRRAHRIQRSKENDEMYAAYRREVLRLEAEQREREADDAARSEGREKVLQSLQVEVITEAWMRRESDVHEDGDDIVAEIEGFVEPVRVKKSIVDAAVRKKGFGGWRAIPLPTDELVDQASGHAIPASDDPNERRALELASHVEFVDTLSMCLWIVRPQHANSKMILFGGSLMRWVEEVSTIAARRVYPACSWSSAAIDSLTFKTAVQLGEVVYVRASVIKVYDSSVEVACTVTCEDRNSATPKIRHVSDSFFTLVAIDPSSGRPLKGVLRQVHLPPGPVTEIAKLADKRREDRLQDKRVLQRVYA